MKIELQDALELYPELEGIIAMKTDGWQFREVAAGDFENQLAGIVGFQNYEQFTDALWIFERNNVVGVRLLDAAYGGGMVWRQDGNLADVIQELKALPQPGDRLAPKLVRASSLLWTP